MGRGDEKAADQAAVDAMRQALNVLDIDGTVVIGEGERDEAPMLYIGEQVGTRQAAPRSTSRSTRWRAPRSPPRAAPTPSPASPWRRQGGFLNAPDIYMDKIAVGGGLPAGMVDIDARPAENLRRLAEAKGVAGRATWWC